MDIDFWSSRVKSAKHFSAVQASRLNSDGHLVMDDSEDVEDVKAYFPCPFCYIDIEVRFICSHLQEEHCFDFRNAVCPLCAANLGKDVLGHFIIQHANSLKRRRKFQKPGLWNGCSPMLGKELSSFLGSSTTGRANAHDSFLQDPLLFPFLNSSSPSNAKQHHRASKVSAATNFESAKPSSPEDSHEIENSEEKHRKATFVQQLLMSTVFETS